MISSKSSPSLIIPCTLIVVTYSIDEIGNQTATETEKTILCAEFPTTQNIFYQAAQLDIKATKCLIISSYDYNGEELVIYKGIKYSVYRTYARADFLTELYLTEGSVKHGN